MPQRMVVAAGTPTRSSPEPIPHIVLTPPPPTAQPEEARRPPSPRLHTKPDSRKRKRSSSSSSTQSLLDAYERFTPREFYDKYIPHRLSRQNKRRRGEEDNRDASQRPWQRWASAQPPASAQSPPRRRHAKRQGGPEHKARDSPRDHSRPASDQRRPPGPFVHPERRHAHRPSTPPRSQPYRGQASAGPSASRAAGYKPGKNSQTNTADARGRNASRPWRNRSPSVDGEDTQRRGARPNARNRRRRQRQKSTRVEQDTSSAREHKRPPGSRARGGPRH